MRLVYHPPVRLERWLFTLALCAPALGAQDRPLATEAATTAPGGTLRFEGGFELLGQQPNFMTGLPRTIWSGPSLRLTYSPADAVELDLEWIALVGQTNDPVFGSGSDPGDVTLRAKWRVRPEQGSRPALGARFSVTLPETSFGTGLGPNTLRMSAEALLSRSLGARLALHANAGLAVLDEPLRPHQQSDLFAFGLALVQRVNSSLDLLGELSGQVGHGEPGADQHLEARLGARVGKGSWRGDAALRRAFAEADGTWGFTVGASWTRPGKH